MSISKLDALRVFPDFSRVRENLVRISMLGEQAKTMNPTQTTTNLVALSALALAARTTTDEQGQQQ